MDNHSFPVAMVFGVALLAVSPSANGGPPPNPTPSDAHENTAGGTNALLNNTDFYNTAFGSFALTSNTTGDDNTAIGAHALAPNTTGDLNTAIGSVALGKNTTGLRNTAIGVATLYSNSTGNYNTASGVQALQHNTTGGYNLAEGYQALMANTTGHFNTAVGWGTLAAHPASIGNTAIGWGAGASLKTGSHNIYLGHPGIAAEGRTLRLGNLQTRAFIAGVKGVPITGNTVLINSNGQLGVMVSSGRYKQDIHPLADQSMKLQQLRPVTFHYKQEPKGPLQYGLIAEEVAKVYPELVTRDADGKIEGVRYEELTPLLLKALQQHHQQLQQLQTMAEEVAELKAQNETLRAAVEAMQQQQRQTIVSR